jgi:hypothetical protein
MLGFNPLSSAPISDLGELPLISGYIDTTDTNDTATLNAEVLAAGYISTTDDNDTCIIVSGGIAAGYIDATDGTDTAQLTGTSSVSGLINTTDTDDTADIQAQLVPGAVGNISATDQNDTALLQGDVVNGPDFHDGLTSDEIRRAKALDKRIHKAEQKRIAAVKAQAARRRQRFIDSLYPDQKAPESFYDPANFDEQGNFVAPKLLTKEQKVKLKKIKKQIDAEPVVDYEVIIAKLKAEQELIIESMLARMRLANLQMQLAIIEAQRQAELDDEEALLLLL